MGGKLTVRISGYRCLTGTNHETRTSYLCSQAAAGRLTSDDNCKLLGYGALEPEIFLLIELEKTLAASRKK